MQGRQKQAIARAAVDLDGETLILDAGSTIAVFAQSAEAAKAARRYQ
jgi:DeoR/GlpR family transcriptional regulator of sugar metabolism